jgi:hypothetical protein
VLDDETYQAETAELNVCNEWTVVPDKKVGGQSLLEKEESEESNKEDDVIEEFWNSQGNHFYEASPTFAYQDKEFSTHLMEAYLLRIHKKANKTNKTVSEEQEEDYYIAELFRREGEELGLVPQKHIKSLKKKTIYSLSSSSKLATTSPLLFMRSNRSGTK